MFGYNFIVSSYPVSYVSQIATLLHPPARGDQELTCFTALNVKLYVQLSSAVVQPRSILIFW